MSFIGLRRAAIASAAIAAALCGPAVAEAPGATALRWRTEHVAVIRSAVAGEHRNYRIFKTSDGVAGASREVAEQPGRPYVRTGHDLFDSLFAMALADAELDRVSQIRDDAFDFGKPIACECFETGEKWHYVWTRDISYSVDLGLAALDPQRSLNSLLFKTSGVRVELLRQGVKPLLTVAQDTGSGGSWPVSTDRVAWIMAAHDVLQYLPATQRRTAVVRLFAIARDTVEQDRRYVFDRGVDLYRGETSFLDWREQNYPSWTRDDVGVIAAGYALSTNVLHIVALRTTAALAKESGAGRAAEDRYRQWAQDLQIAVNARFWDERRGLYASYLSPGPNSVRSASYDLLGLALAIIHGIADDARAHSILQRYPIGAAGPPVLWPQQPDIAIYHNRAIWPFVTAYALRAAKAVRHAELATDLVQSLIRGSALSLSNMENFEFETLATAGPVINSPRQLWSVAGYLSMVIDTLWGLHVRDGRLSVDAWLPGPMAEQFFRGQRELSLHDFSIGGKMLNVTLRLPQFWPADASLEAETLSLNGVAIESVDIARLASGGGGANELRITMRVAGDQPQAMTRIDFGQRRAVFAPHSPELAAAHLDNGSVQLAWEGREPGAAVRIYRDGAVLADRVPAASYRDSPVRGREAACYLLTQQSDGAGLESLWSRESCVSDPKIIVLRSPDVRALTRADGMAFYSDWGAAGQTLESNFSAREPGAYRLQIKYANFQGPVNTGITAALKSVSVRCGGRPVQTGSLVMPHISPQSAWAMTSVVFHAAAGDRCRIQIADGFNMSYLDHFVRYTGGKGGASGALNRADIAAGAYIGLIRGAGS